MSRPWRRLEDSELAHVPVNTGVFALREVGGSAVSVHLAGARSPLGLRSALEAVRTSRPPRPLEFTYVSTNNYFTLFRERRDFPDRFDAADPFLRRDGHSVAQRGAS